MSRLSPDLRGSRGGPSGPFPGWKTTPGSPRSSSGRGGCARTPRTPWPTAAPAWWAFTGGPAPWAPTSLPWPRPPGTSRGTPPGTAPRRPRPDHPKGRSAACSRSSPRPLPVLTSLLYQTVRYNTHGYHLDMPVGTYTVTLRFVEPAYDKAGVRVFGVGLQGEPVIDSLDIFERAGKNKALDFTFKNVAVTDGRLRIDFTYLVEFPCIAAIEVEGPAGSRKINCGGAGYQDHAADWPATAAGEGRPQRFLPVDDFYADWATAQFGSEVGSQAASIFSRLDGHTPRPIDWINGPGGIKPDPRPWDQVRNDYAFIDELAVLRSRVRGAGNLERFDYWLNSFRYLKAAARANCAWHRFDEAMVRVKAEKTPKARQRLARELALPIRKEILAAVADLHRHLLATVTTPGELGTVANWQQHNLPDLVFKPGRELAAALGSELPAAALPSRTTRASRGSSFPWSARASWPASRCR